MKLLLITGILAISQLVCHGQAFLPLGWDYPEAEEANIDEFRLYQVHGGQTNIVARPAPDQRQTTVEVEQGKYTFWLTAANEIESDPSNQLTHPGQPAPGTNLRVLAEITVNVNVSNENE